MCGTCGCGEDNHVTYTKPGKDHHHHEHHDHEHGHEHEHEHGHHHHSKEIQLEMDVLAKNNLTAQRNRGYFEALNIITLNLVSSPGSGKTSLLEKTIRELKSELDLYIIEGDQQTMHDADRINKAGAPVIQVNTGNGCHLDADMVHHAVKELNPKQGSVLFIENVGNLVCPSLFDLGESKRVVIISTTEGEDKPIKYPTMFESSQLCVINKTDLLPYVDFDVEKAKEYARQVNPTLEFIELSVTSGEGLPNWYAWLKKLQK
ncbi:MAG: hydrogenase accessory protein HypB [Bacteroidetes bacterium]|nr:MAG: hydrogenase accessory protein HypB [Bacteroidota bacterium]RLD88345.1 MAG: hydrogenase accessory protein HypB [Bacteroidota bacterium]